MRLLFYGLAALTLILWLNMSESMVEATSKRPPKSGLNLKLRPDAFTRPAVLENIRNMKFKGIGWSELRDRLSKWSSPTKAKADEEEPPNVPNPSINAVLNASMIESLDSGVFIAQFFNYVLTGRYDGVTLIGDEYDDQTLNAILSLGINLYISILDLEEEIPQEAFDIVDDLERIRELLANEGSTAVLFKDLKPYLTYDTFFGILQVYVAFNSATWAKRFQEYLFAEFLGGVGQDTPCQIHSAAWFSDFPAGELWAILMFDALGKLPTGVSQGNINWMGSIDTCRDVPNATDSESFGYIFSAIPLKGKYCRADIGFPVDQFLDGIPIEDDFGLSLGMCVSQTCNTEQVKSIVSNSLKLLSAFKVSWVNRVECLEEEYELPTSTIVWTVLLSILVGFVGFCTIFDVVKRIIDFSKGPVMSQDPDVIKAKEEIVGKNVVPTQVMIRQRTPKIVKFFQDCSMYTNSVALFRTDNGGKITCLNGIRVLSMTWIIFGHTFNYIANRDKFFLLDNIFAIQKLNEELYAQVIINAVFGVDTFFLMSAFLLTMSLLTKLQKNGRLSAFEWAYYYIHRYWRLMPPFMIIIILNIYVAPYMLKGPLLNPDTFPPYNQECRDYWWAFLIFLNNFIPEGRGSFCMSYLWYIPNDYQFYALSPIAVYLLFKFPAAGKVLIGGLGISTLLTLGFLSANVYIANERYIVDVLLDMWVDVYIKPYCRALPWLVGILLGYIFFKYKNIKLHYGQVAIGWIVSTLLIASVIFGGFTNHAADARRMEVWEYAIFFSLTKLAWALALAWIIFACHYGYGGVVNSILSGSAYIPLTRLSFSAYLIHPTMMIYFYFLQEGLFHATLLTLVYVAIGHIVMTFTLSFFYTMFFELPFVALERLAYDPRKGGAGH